MRFSQRQSLEKFLNEIAEAPIQDLSSCSPQLLQKVRDKVSRIITQDQATESALQSGNTRQCVPVKSHKRQGTRETASTSPLVIQSRTTHERTDAGHESLNPGLSSTKANKLVTSLVEQITDVSNFLEKDVEKILRDGVRQSHEDPRIEDIGRMTDSTVSDEFRFTLGCLTLFDDYEHFAPADRKNTKSSSQRAFGLTLGIDDGGKDKLRYGIGCGKKVRRLISDCGCGIIGFLLFVKWHRAKEEEMAGFGRLCVAKKEINERMPISETFITKCLNVYRTFVHERRVGTPKQSLPQKRKRPITDVPARGHRINGSQQPPSQWTSGLSVQPHPLLPVAPLSTEALSRGPTIQQGPFLSRDGRPINESAQPVVGERTSSDCGLSSQPRLNDSSVTPQTSVEFYTISNTNSTNSQSTAFKYPQTKHATGSERNIVSEQLAGEISQPDILPSNALANEPHTTAGLRAADTLEVHGFFLNQEAMNLDIPFFGNLWNELDVPFFDCQ